MEELGDGGSGDVMSEALSVDLRRPISSKPGDEGGISSAGMVGGGVTAAAVALHHKRWFNKAFIQAYGRSIAEPRSLLCSPSPGISSTPSEA